MKIAALVSIAAASCPARDAKSFFDKIIGEQENADERRSSDFPLPETEGLYKLSRFYLQLIGGGSSMISKVNSMLSYGCWFQIRNQQANGIVAGVVLPSMR